MRLGLFMMPMHPPSKRHADAYDVDLQTLELADRLGFDEAWIGEHFTSAWENVPAPDLMIAAALQRTQRIRLGTGVNCLPNHNPVVLAHRIAQLDHMARGRFNWGIGSGGFPGDFELFQVDDKQGEHRSMTRDTVDLVLKIWDAARARGNGVASETDHWKFSLPSPRDWGLWVHMAPFQAPHPPIAVAGLGKYSETLALAGERGWIPMSINFVPPTTLRTHWDAFEAGASKTAASTDRREWRIARDIYVAETTEQARREALDGAQATVFREYFLPLLRDVGQMGLFKTDGQPADDQQITIEWLMDNIWIVGSPDDVAARLRQLYTDVGGYGGVLQLVYDWGEQQDRNFRSLELMATRVLPQLEME